MKKQNTPNQSFAVRALFGLVTLLFAAGMMGCDGVTVGSVCDKWDKKNCPNWHGKTACENSGHAAFEAARDAKCEPLFQDYLECVDAANSCSWDVVCATEKAALENCQGSIF